MDVTIFVTVMLKRGGSGENITRFVLLDLGSLPLPLLG